MVESNPRRATMNDVARQAGVSYQTVSRVINNHPYVAAKTRQRVLQVIQDLDYRPNKAAKSLVTQRSQTLAVITFGMDHFGPAQMMIHIERAAKDAGYDLIFANITDTSVASMRTAMHSFASWSVDGILAITPVVGVTCAEMHALCAEVPLVQIDIRRDEPAPSVVIDQWLGGQLVTQHLLDLGHTRLAGISGPLDWFGAEARQQSWEHTLKQAGLTPGPSVEGDWSAQSGYDGANKLLAAGADFTALVVGNDQMALGAIRALQEHGLRIPEDVSVTGFDNLPESAFFAPPLTTVHQDFDALGKQGVEYLIERIADPVAASGQRVIRPRLIQRASTAPPSD